MTRVPATLAETLEPAMLRALEDKLAPPPALRAKARLEFEIEAAGEGTFTIIVHGPAPLSARKGFARDPFISVHISKGGWPLLQREMQELVNQLPNAPILRKHVETLNNPRPGELDALVAATKNMKDASARFEVKGGGVYVVARGPVDEATRVLQIGLDAAEIDRVLAGAPPTLLKASIGGDRSVLSMMAGAMAPLLARLR
jgi:hypothetical protein